jgi:hypothetical protein
MSLPSLAMSLPSLAGDGSTEAMLVMALPR